MRFHHIAIAALVAALSAAPAKAQEFFATSGLGMDTVTIDAGNPVNWTFYTANDYLFFHGGIFALKAQPGTTNGIRMQLLDPSTTSFGEVVLTPAQFTSAGGNTSTYAKIEFLQPITPLTSFEFFTVSLSVDGAGSGGYSVRGTLPPDFATLVLGNSAALVTVSSDQGSGSGPTATPEPAAALVLAGALLGLATLRRRQAGAA